MKQKCLCAAVNNDVKRFLTASAFPDLSVVRGLAALILALLRLRLRTSRALHFQLGNHSRPGLELSRSFEPSSTPSAQSRLADSMHIEHRP